MGCVSLLDPVGRLAYPIQTLISLPLSLSPFSCTPLVRLLLTPFPVPVLIESDKLLRDMIERLDSLACGNMIVPWYKLREVSAWQWHEKCDQWQGLDAPSPV